MALLDYENQIFLDAFQEDGLLVMAKYLHFQYMVLSLSVSLFFTYLM